MQEKDKKIVELQHGLSELKHDFQNKESECKELEEKYNSKISISQKVIKNKLCFFQYYISLSSSLGSVIKQGRM